MEKFYVKSFTSGPIRVHPYIIIDREAKVGCVIDPGGDSDLILDEFAKEQAHLKYIFNTHYHPDHVAHNGIIKDIVSTVQIAIGKDDVRLLETDFSNFAKKFDYPIIAGKADIPITDGQTFDIGGIQIKCITVPGHTPGSVCFYSPELKSVFTGDTLFQGLIGRIDLPTSTPEKMFDSLMKLIDLPNDTQVFPGHGRTSIMGNEKDMIRKMHKDFNFAQSKMV